MKEAIKSLFNKFPYVRGLYEQVQLTNKNGAFPSGHFYSPIISVDDIAARQNKIWANAKKDGIAGVDLNTAGQIALVKELTAYYSELPFKEAKQENLRYYMDNIFYTYSDGIVLYEMMRHFKPKRIIEAGSGFSSAAMMDVNDLFFDGKILLTFIEPYNERLLSLMNEKDKKATVIKKNIIQDIEPDFFRQLEKGDFLFIDSSHVSKCGSDVNYILFEILPVLNPGVLIHFHDIFYPLEYPVDWVLDKMNWNEDYILKAFLMYNNQFQIKLFTHYLQNIHPESFAGMPLAYQNHGANIWIEKL